MATFPLKSNGLSKALRCDALCLTRPIATKAKIGSQQAITLPGSELEAEAIHTARHTNPADKYKQSSPCHDTGKHCSCDFACASELADTQTYSRQDHLALSKMPTCGRWALTMSHAAHVALAHWSSNWSSNLRSTLMLQA